MTNPERAPDEVTLSGEACGPALLEPREVPLGGPRAMTVRRTLPQRERSLIGAWCFLDHYGPDEVAATGGMQVPPHPHTGLATVSWLFTGEIRHRDSLGNDALVRPGELNLMTAGRGISHSERSTEQTDTLHGAQLWLALPEAARSVEPAFEHYAPPAITGPGWQARVFLGELAGHASPVATHTALVGAELIMEPGIEVEFVVRRGFEHGVLVDAGEVRVGDLEVPTGALAYLPPGEAKLRIANGRERARLLLLGGEPFGEDVVMWWNFVGRSHDEIVAYRAAWQAEIGAGPAVDAPGASYGLPAGDPGVPLPAPELPNAPIKPRRNPAPPTVDDRKESADE